MSGTVNWERALSLRPVPFLTHCDHHAEAKASRVLVEKRDAELAELRAERESLRHLLASVVHHSGGMVPVTYPEQDEAFDLPLDIFGWRGELVVVRTADRGAPVDGDALDAALGEQP